VTTTGRRVVQPARGRAAAPVTPGAQALRDVALALVEEHVRDGMIPTSVRFLYYELVQRRVIAKHDPHHRKQPGDYLVAALTHLRKAGLVPWEYIVDETRTLDDYTGYPTIIDGVVAGLDQFALDAWRGEPPMIVTESRSLAGVLRPIAIEYAVRISATGGQASGSLIHNIIAPSLEARPGAILYLGDWDLSGDQIEDNTRRELEEIVGDLEWERVALTAAQVEEHDLPVIIKNDRRYRGGRAHEAVETEALRQSILVDLLRDRLDELLPEPIERVRQRAARQRSAVRRLLNGGRRR
jgi:hypothetical protein